MRKTFGDVHLAVVEGLEDAQGFELAADASGAVVEMAGRQPRFVLLDRFGQAVEDAPVPPAFRDLTEFAGHVHPRERAHDRAHPRVALLQLPDPQLRRLAIRAGRMRQRLVLARIRERSRASIRV